MQKEIQFNRLGALIKMKGTSKEEFAERFSISLVTLNAYLNGNRNIPIDRAIEFTTAYDVTLDWFFGKSQYPNECEALSSVLLSLRKVLEYREDTKFGYPVLYIDKQFANYLKEIYYLRYSKPINDPDYMKYSKDVENIQNRYKEYFSKIWNVSQFNMDKAVEIIFAEDLNFVDLVGRLKSLESQ